MNTQAVLGWPKTTIAYESQSCRSGIKIWPSQTKRSFSDEFLGVQRCKIRVYSAGKKVNPKLVDAFEDGEL